MRIAFIFLWVLLIVFFKIESHAQECSSIFRNQIQEVLITNRDLKNTLLRLTNIKTGIESYPYVFKLTGERIIFMFEQVNHSDTVNRHVKEELDILQARVYGISDLNQKMGVLLNDALKQGELGRKSIELDTETRLPSEIKKANKVRGDEIKLVKFLTGAMVTLPTAVGSVVMFGLDVPAKEVLISFGILSSYMGYRFFSSFIDSKYRDKPLNVLRENDLDGVRDITEIYIYDAFYSLVKELKEDPQSGVRVIFLSENLKPQVMRLLKENKYFQLLDLTM